MSHRLGFLALAAAVILLSQPASAATFTVNSTVDGLDASPGNGVCLTPISTCTLRAAIQESNALAGEDLIIVPAGTYLLNRPGTSEDQCVNGDLDVRESVTIRGDGPDRTVVDGNSIDRVFDLVPPSNATIRFEGIGIHNGLLPLSALYWDGGGGVQISGPVTATFERCRLHGNRASSAWSHSGYAIHAYAVDSLTLLACEIDENRRTDGATIDGMALGFHDTTGNYRLERSWVHNNDGVGVFEDSVVSTVIDRSTIEVQGGRGVSVGGRLYLLSSTLAYNQNGGLEVRSSASLVYAVNSTLSSNVTDLGGGGILAYDGIVDLSSVTITGNIADGDASGSGNGGGIQIVPGADVRLRHVALGSNSDWSPTVEVHPDCSGTVYSERFNLISNAVGCTITGDTGGNIGGVLPGLGPLDRQGGLTPVHVPLPGSPVVDAGDEYCTDINGALVQLDQRGYPRTVEGDDLPGTYCDMGAAERWPGMLFMDGFETGLAWAWSATVDD
ncbi:MAG TPA: CSLREA domain-containing protein [Thermoanaerobaculales bacterium]|nr:CSLREA domain-containing protein [Thermoanaerobaculales bacterium]HQL29704.1 CSLREA domain-containing protein [Thermoanaerobaculales bacterium]